MSNINTVFRTDPAHAARGAQARELVHKIDQDGVLLTDWCAGDRGTVRIAAAWPVTHPFYTAGSATGLPADPLLVIETLRQAGLLAAHTAHGVPLGRQFGWERLDLALEPAPRPLVPTGQVEVEVRTTEVVRRGDRVAHLTFEYLITRGWTRLASGRTPVSIQDMRVYRRLRGAAGEDAAAAFARALPPEPPIPEWLVGRRDPQDVLLAAASASDAVVARTPGTGQRSILRLRLDTRHPVLFDHVVDHVPGTVLLEAARQAATALLYPLPIRLTALGGEFRRYVELDRECLVEAVVLHQGGSGPSQVRVRFLQGPAEPAACTVDLVVRPAVSESTSRRGRAHVG